MKQPTVRKPINFFAYSNIEERAQQQIQDKQIPFWQFYVLQSKGNVQRDRNDSMTCTNIIFLIFDIQFSHFMIYAKRKSVTGQFMIN